MKKCIAILLAAVSLVLFTGCANIANEQKANSRAEKIAPEVTDVNFSSENGMTIGGNYVDFMSEEKKLVDCKNLEWQDDYHEWSARTDDGVVFCHQYAVRGKDIRVDDILVENAHRIDAGIFKVNVRTGEMSLLKDIKNIVPPNLFGTGNLYIIQRTVKNRYLLMHYSGRLEVFDYINGETTYSAQVYPDPEKYTRLRIGANAQFVNGNDYMFLKNGVFDYYVYTGGAYEKYSFIDPMFTDLQRAERYKDVLYVLDLSKLVYAVDFRTGVRLPEAELQESYETAKQTANEEANRGEIFEPEEYRLGGARFKIEEKEEYNGFGSKTETQSLTLTNLETQEKITVDGALLQTNSAFSEIENIYNKYYSGEGDEFILRGWQIDNNRLFLFTYRALYNTWVWHYSPTFVFEFLPGSGEIKYCGMNRDPYKGPYTPFVCVAE